MSEVMHWHRVTKADVVFDLTTPESFKLYKIYWTEPIIKCLCCASVVCTDLRCLLNEMGK